MNYNKMPRQELIEELQSWENKFNYRLENEKIKQESVLKKDYEKKLQEIRKKEKKVIKINNKSLEECLCKLLEFEKESIGLFSENIKFKNIHLYIKYSCERVFRWKKIFQEKEDLKKIEDAVKLILDRVKQGDIK